MMTTHLFPERHEWDTLTQRPSDQNPELSERVQVILDDVNARGDAALKELTATYDGVVSENIKYRVRSDVQLDKDLRDAITIARDNIQMFHEAQQQLPEVIETMPGVSCWRKSVPIERVGLYVPGGSAPLFSTLLMLGIPARIAGCENIVVCTPPSPDGGVHPAIEFTAALLGIEWIHLVGGAQAIGAMAYGTESVPQTYKIFGPGNQYVTAAKQMIQQQGVAIDMPAGPSEVLVIADSTSNPEFIAADLLSQAEHGPDSQAILVTSSPAIIADTLEEIKKQLPKLPRAEVARKSVENSWAVLLADEAAVIDFSNAYAPEHLIINCENSIALSERVKNAGSVFIGPWSCESLGDYASGTNHTLPTNGYARNYSGVSLDSFMKKITFQRISPEGMRHIGPIVETMAEAEELQAHRNAVTVRLNNLP